MIRGISLFLTLLFCGLNLAQEVIPLPKTEDSFITWETPERQFYSKNWETQTVTNVSQPSIEVFRPSPKTNTGTAVIVAPGGALYALSIESEGNQVAEWLVKKGVTVFVLKYRLVPTGKDATEELKEAWPDRVLEEAGKVLPLAIADGLNAVSYVRKNAKKYGVLPDKIGFLGFSAGGAVTMGAGYNYTHENRPNFLVPVYPWTDVLPVAEPKTDVPPMFIVCATDDPLKLAKGSIALYTSMQKANKNVSIMMYAKGGHGFGMKTQGLPSDNWIVRFYDWAVSEALIATTSN